MTNARLLAVKALSKVNSEKAYSNITLDKFFSENNINEKDKALATALFYGVLDRKITLDFVISKYSKLPIKKISSLTIEAIRIALFQLMFMEKIPESAAVNESVNIIKVSKEGRNSGFVNAVLRNYLRNPIELPKGNSPYELSIRFSCPEDIIKSFISDYGIDDTIKLLEASLNSPPVTVRVNTLKSSAKELREKFMQDGICADECSDINAALNIIGGIDFKNNILYKNGAFHVQDLASQKAIEKLGLKPDERVLDLCAAPGGKSFTMAEIMENKGEVLALDIYEKRVTLIENGAKRLGISIIKTAVGDASVYNSNLGKFDAVLCDVPCSGLGVLRRKPEIKYKPIEDYSDLEEIQFKILNNSVKYLKSTGRILYSTCTLRKNENENIVNKFLEENKDFILSYQHTFMPHTDNTDGFFCALLLKK